MFEKITGSWATLLLPIRNDDSIDYELLEKELLYLASSRPDGIYSNGTAGEFFSQSEAEFQNISALLEKVCKAEGVPFQIGCSHPDPNISLSRVRYAAKLSPDAIQVILPDWFPSNNRAAIRFLKRAAEEADGIPLVLYNPPHAKRRLTPEEFLCIIEEVPAIKSIKTADGDDSWYKAMQPVMSAVSVFVPGHHLATGFSKGAAGAYSNVACLAPKKAVLWHQLMKKDIKRALEEERKLQIYFSSYIDPLIISDGYPNFAIDKLLCVVGGYLPGMTSRVRFPYDSVDMKIVDSLQKRLREIAPFFVEEESCE